MLLAVASACGSGGDQAVRAADRPAPDQRTREDPPSAALAGPAAGDALAATRSALEAWGRFTATGDLTDVAPYFNSGGPQFLRFEDDAAEIRASRRPPTRFAVTSLEAGPGGEEQQVVNGTLVASRPGEEEKRAEWEFTLFRDPARGWQVWTVKDRSTGVSPVPT